MKLNIKPLSINEAWKGRRYKTNKYNKYVNDLMLLLPKMNIPKGELSLILNVGYSSKGSDIDNFLKPFIDVLQKKYDFDDNKIYKLTVSKLIVKKGSEFIDFEILKHE